MTSIYIATKANQATILPAILVATYVNESDPNASISIHLQDLDVLKSGDDATVRLDSGSTIASYGSETIILKLIAAHHVLQSKHADLVSCQYQRCVFVAINTKSI